jgi:hypothetical protein
MLGEPPPAMVVRLPSGSSLWIRPLYWPEM